MSLNYDLTKVANWASYESEDNWPVTKAIIFATMSVDIGEITEANAAEFHARYIVMSRLAGLNGPSWTVADVRALAGLRTNVVTSTTAQFGARLGRIAKDDLRTEIYRQKSALTAASV